MYLYPQALVSVNLYPQVLVSVNKFCQLYTNNTRSLAPNDPESYPSQNVNLLSALGMCHADVLTTILLYDKLCTKSYMASM
jgi:hypothetical protein